MVLLDGVCHRERRNIIETDSSKGDERSLNIVREQP